MPACQAALPHCPAVPVKACPDWFSTIATARLPSPPRVAVRDAVDAVVELAGHVAADAAAAA